jgi:hypothetical protein
MEREESSTKRGDKRVTPRLMYERLRIVEPPVEEAPSVPSEAELESAKMALRDPVLPNLTVSPDFARLLAASRLFAKVEVPVDPTVSWVVSGGDTIRRHLEGRDPVPVMRDHCIEVTFAVGDVSAKTREKAREFARAISHLYNGLPDREPVVEMRRISEQHEFEGERLKK